MSFLNLNSNITRLRKEKGITQEALAEFAGVTKASVSKWETGTTTPDIQLLPVLAAFFDVSVDELLGYESQLSTKQIRYYYHKLAEKFAVQDFEVVWEECRELVKKYYGCYPFLMQMATLYLNHCPLAKTKEGQAEVLTQAEQLCSRVIEGSEDSSLCENAVSIRAVIWLQQGKAERIIQTMEKEVMDINHISNKSAVLPMAYLSIGDMSMAEKSSQIGLYRNLSGMLNHLLNLLMSTQGGEAYCREVLNRTDKILEAFQMEGLNPNMEAVYQYQAALKLCMLLIQSGQAEQQTAGQAVQQCMKQGEKWKSELEEEIYQRLERYVQMVCRLYRDGIKVHGDTFFFRLEDWFEQLDLGPEGVRDGKVILTDCITSLGNPAFEILQDKKRLNNCVKRLGNLQQGE